MTGPRRDCPPPNVLAMFVEGTLSSDRITAVIAHLSLCAECRILVECVSELESQESDGDPADAEPVHRSESLWITAAAVLSALLIGSLLLQQRLVEQKWRKEIRTLATALPHDQRVVEARLTGGFRWAPFYGPARQGEAPPSAAELFAVAAAAEFASRIPEQSSDAALHAKAVALVIAGNPARAIEVLEQVVDKQRDNPLVWSDLAAAIYTDAQRRNDPSALRRSVEAAENAVAANPQLAEGHFNRALALERLGDQDRAISAWREYLRHDRGSRWATEVEARLLSLEQTDHRP